MSNVILEVKDLQISFDIDKKTAYAVNNLNFMIKKDQTLGIVGESGSGKSLSALAIMGLIPFPPGKIEGGEILFKGMDLVKLEAKAMQKIRGKDISMIFQEPMTALNPVFTIGQQICETLMLHEKMNKKEASERAVELLSEVGIAEASSPSILIADEPTTALDVSVQAQIFQLLKNIQRAKDTAIIFITHDMGSIASMADRVIVMYAGRCVEAGTTAEILLTPQHPYTKGLIACIPHLNKKGGKIKERLNEIPGIVPSLLERGKGCSFAPRCSLAQDICFEHIPETKIFGNERRIACWQAKV